eukprot:8705562-Ditylum_brightwellii.AAC.1
MSCIAGYKFDKKEIIHSSLKHFGCTTSLLACCDGGHEFAYGRKGRSGEIGAIVMGFGGEDIANLVTFLDVPHPKGMGRVPYPVLRMISVKNTRYDLFLFGRRIGGGN